MDYVCVCVSEANGVVEKNLSTKIGTSYELKINL